MKTLTTLLLLGISISLCSCVNGRYQGPPITVSGSYDGFGGSVRIDPSFAAQKK